jgi:hypothetical protein
MRISTVLMRAPQLFGSAPNVLKPELLAAIDATDTWIDNNAAAYNNALPTTFRANATSAQKTFLFCAVAIARVSIAFLRAIFGSVD